MNKRRSQSADEEIVQDSLEGAVRERLDNNADDPYVEDMFAVARIAQEVDAVSFRRPGAVTLMAPAKVNLYLEIGNAREDGYHDVVTVMHSLLLHDTLRMRLEPGQVDVGLTIELTSRACKGIKPLDVPPESNIVSKAVRKLAVALDRDCDETMVVSIEKRIPAEGGLGGGSSDAAAALIGAARLWGIDSQDSRIEEVARSLGADVAFFLHGGCACLTGVGDVLSHSLVPMSSCVALIKPEQGVSTAQAYRAFDEDPQPISGEDQHRAFGAKQAEDVPVLNNMEAASESVLPELREVRMWALEHEDVSQALVSGSGSTVFAICPSFDAASRVVSQAHGRGWWARSTMFSKAGASIAPAR